MASLELSDVCKSFGDLQVVSNVSLEIEDGEFVVFVGPSGCGKSTLLRMIAGLEDISSGKLTIDQQDMTLAEPSERHVAMVFQSYALYPHMTVRGNLGFALRMSGLSAAEVAEKVEPVAEMLQLTGLMGRRPSQLSGGQRQRVAIGRALVRSPQVFLFDEPLSNLDAELRVQMRVELAQLHKQIGITTIYVTHDQVEAMTLADRIVVIRDGSIEQVGTPLELYNDPESLFVAGFIGSPRINQLDAEIAEISEDKLTVVLPGQVTMTYREPFSQIKVGDRLTVSVRPERLEVANEGDTSCDVTTMHVDYWEHLGGVSYAYGSLPNGQPFIFEQRLDDSRFEASTLDLRLNPAWTLLFDTNGKRIRPDNR